MGEPLDIGALCPLLGESRIRGLVAAFYQRVPADPVLGPMYPPQDMAGAEQRLADFLIYRLGGPPTYIEQRGHPRLRMRHMPFAVTPVARDHWMGLMSAAVAEVIMGDDMAGARDALLGFFATVADQMVNRDG